MQGLGGVRAERPGGYAEHVTVAAEAAAPVPPDLDPLDVAALASSASLPTRGCGGSAPRRPAHPRHRRGRRRRVGRDGDRPRGGRLGRRRGLAPLAGRLRPRARRRGGDGVLRPGDLPAAPAGERGRRPRHGRGRPLRVARGGAATRGRPVARGRRRGRSRRVRRLAAHPPRDAAGYSTETLDGPTLRAAVATLVAGLADGSIRPPARIVVPLAEASRAHALLGTRGVTGRVILVP